MFPPGIIVNVSRRFVLTGAAASGALVLGIGAAAGRHGGRSECLRRHRPGRRGDHRRASLRNGHRHPHQPAHGGGRRNGGRLVARARDAGAGDEQKYGNQDTDGSRSFGITSSRCAGAARRCGRCWNRRRRALGRGSCSVKAENHKCAYRAAASSASANSPPRRARCRCRRSISFGSRTPANSAISARARFRSSTCTTSPRARRPTDRCQDPRHAFRGGGPSAGHRRPTGVL